MIRTKRNLEIRFFIAENFLEFYQRVGEKEFPFKTAVQVCRRNRTYSPLTCDVDVYYSIRNHLRKLVAEKSASALVCREKHGEALLDYIRNKSK